MNRVLEQIIIKKREDLREKKKKISLEKLKEGVKGLWNEKYSGMRFFDSLFAPVKQASSCTSSILLVAQNDIAVIAEVKFASPSMEDIDLSIRPHPDTLPRSGRGQALKGEENELSIFDMSKDLVKRVKEYESAGAEAISIITEQHFFKGDPSFVTIVKNAVALPILQKDFVIDEYQIYEARLRPDFAEVTSGRQGFGGQACGADALLLIARIVDKKTLRHFVDVCFEEGIEPVVEIFSEEDLEKAAATKTRFVAVNSRDLDTFEVDVEKACELMKKIPERFIRLGFSGIQSAVEVQNYKNAGAKGVLVGTALMRTKKIDDFILSLRGGTTKQSGT
ncbi:indole-3-glycerol phosphate synthase TrpC [Patescibacteria group bacterium]|nr:indole-3-glycerol phosphate synthase TrpC [Patescibacteria group bacterium]MBU4098888.1 indole-3-glycerol phosphate synthase TrpC [Patescibacteria group bacterium]